MNIDNVGNLLLIGRETHAFRLNLVMFSWVVFFSHIMIRAKAFLVLDYLKKCRSLNLLAVQDMFNAVTGPNGLSCKNNCRYHKMNKEFNMLAHDISQDDHPFNLLFAQLDAWSIHKSFDWKPNIFGFPMHNPISGCDINTNITWIFVWTLHILLLSPSTETFLHSETIFPWYLKWQENAKQT